MTGQIISVVFKDSNFNQINISHNNTILEKVQAKIATSNNKLKDKKGRKAKSPQRFLNYNRDNYYH